MKKSEYKKIEDYMINQMQDSAHDMYHIYRVLYSALDIANHTSTIDIDVLITACLLHDIGRVKQSANLNLCHAQVGADMAYEFLLSEKWEVQQAFHVKECISSHRYRGDNPPKSIEAKILYDADKLEASGAIGIARVLIYGGQIIEPLYVLDEEKNIVIDGGNIEKSSFFQEYNYKLKNIYDSFFTERAKAIALERQKTAVDFYNGLYNEISENHKGGLKNLYALLSDF